MKTQISKTLMNSRLNRFVVATVCAVAIAFPIALPAQDSAPQAVKHHRYRVVVLETDGGMNSYLPGFDIFAPLTQRGTIGMYADTAIAGVDHSYTWRDGQRTNLQTLSGGLGAAYNTTFISWINQWDLAAGYSSNGQTDPIIDGAENNAVVWTPDGQIFNLGTLGGYQSEATWVNDFGQVTGWVENTTPDPFFQNLVALGIVPTGAGAQTQMFIWQDGVIERLGTLGGPDSYGGFINNRGQITGFSYTSDIPNTLTGVPPFDPFLWENGTMTDINPGNFGGAEGGVNFINNNGQVVGFGDLNGDVDVHPFLWDKGKITDLFTVGNLGGGLGSAYNVNEEGHVVGISSLPMDVAIHPVLWRNGEFADLGTVDGDDCGEPSSINSYDQIVGVSFSCSSGTSHAFLWENGKIVDLDMLIPSASGIQLNYAGRINEEGEIAAQGVLIASGETRAVLLIPAGDCDKACEAAILATKQASKTSSNVARSSPLSPQTRAQLRQPRRRPN
jgi:probable HAF family extracellular repeat protein